MAVRPAARRRLLPALRVDILTIFPRMFAPVLGASIIQRARKAGRLAITAHDLRRYTHDTHRSVDDRPYGGGPGMVMKPEPMYEAVEAVTAKGRQRAPDATPHVVLMSPGGERFTAAMAQALARQPWLVIICGHYEGVDERVHALADRVVSIGDYVLTGGELPAMVVIDTVARFVPGVIGHAQATAEESFVDGLLEYPQYTRPPTFRGMEVPEVLRSGDHAAVARWRRQQAQAKTAAARPDLVERAHEHGKR